MPTISSNGLGHWPSPAQALIFRDTSNIPPPIDEYIVHLFYHGETEDHLSFRLRHQRRDKWRVDPVAQTPRISRIDIWGSMIQSIGSLSTSMSIRLYPISRDAVRGEGEPITHITSTSSSRLCRCGVVKLTR